MLIWVREQGYEWDRYECLNIAKRNENIKMLKWIENNK